MYGILSENQVLIALSFFCFLKKKENSKPRASPDMKRTNNNSTSPSCKRLAKQLAKQLIYCIILFPELRGHLLRFDVRNLPTRP